jgi:sugar lactone lactonase YvrE
MPLNFPSSPAQDDEYTYQSSTYIYSGVKWQLSSTKYSYQGGEFTSAASISVDLTTGNIFSVTQDISTSVIFINPPTSGNAIKFQMSIKNNKESTPWDLSTASYDNTSFSVSSQDSFPYSIAFKPDGTRMFMLGALSDSVYQYTLTTPWDISTAVYDNTSFSVSSQASLPNGIAFKPDGTRMFIIGGGSDSVHQYTLTTPWDLSTASYDNTSFSVSSQAGFPSDVAFKPDGTRMFMLGGTSDRIYQYTLTTPWDLSTAAYANTSFSVTAQESNPNGIAFKPDGTRMFMLGRTSDSVHQYTLTTPWDLSTASYDNTSFSVRSQDSLPYSIAFKPDGTRMFITGGTSDSVHQYTTIPEEFAINWPTTVQWQTGTAPAMPSLNNTSVFEFYTSNSGTTYYASKSQDDIS